MKAKVGDVIEWEYDGMPYYAIVSAIIDGGYGVHFVYKQHDFSQDIIPDSMVTAVYRKVDE